MSAQRIPYDLPQTWYFTFGFSQPNARCYYVVREATGDQARERMFELFGREWGFQYDEVAWFKHGVSQAEQYDLTEVT